MLQKAMQNFGVENYTSTLKSINHIAPFFISLYIFYFLMQWKKEWLWKDRGPGRQTWCHYWSLEQRLTSISLVEFCIILWECDLLALLHINHSFFPYPFIHDTYTKVHFLPVNSSQRFCWNEKEGRWLQNVNILKGWEVLWWMKWIEDERHAKIIKQIHRFFWIHDNIYVRQPFSRVAWCYCQFYLRLKLITNVNPAEWSIIIIIPSWR